MTRKVAIPLVLFLCLPLWFCSRESPLELEQLSRGKLKLSLAKAEPVVLVPGDTATVQVRVTDQDGLPVPGKVVRFDAVGAIVRPTQVLTDSGGLAQTTLVAGSQPGEIHITASCDGADSLHLKLQVAARYSPLLMLEAEPEQSYADGVTSILLLASLSTTLGQSGSGVPVTFRTLDGQSIAIVPTDSSGIAKATLTAPASIHDIQMALVAEASGVSDTVTVNFLGLSLSLEAVPDHIRADGESEAEIQARLKETTSKVAVPGATLTFATDLGTIPATAETDASGVARVTLRSGTTPGVATVVATYGGLRDTVYVEIGEVGAANLTLRVEPAVLPADGKSTALVTARVTDAANRPVRDGTVVHFEIVRGGGTVDHSGLTSAGEATVTLVSATEPGEALIRATVGDLSDTVVVRYTAGEPAAISLVADSTSLPADGVTTTLVRAYVFDAAGNPVVDGTPVSFEADLGNISERALTENGVALASFSGTQTGIATITARSGEAEANVTIVLRPGPPASVLLTFDPKSVGVKDSGKNQTLQIIAAVRDSRNNPVADGTYVKFEIVASPGGGETLSTYDPVPTVNGEARVSFTAGTRSGPVRVRAVVTDAAGVPLQPEVRSTATEFLIHAGPPYIENIYVVGSSHLSVGAQPINVLGWGVVNNTVDIVVVVGDKYNNPVPAGTAVYFTTSGGVISTHTGFTDEEGVARVTLHTGQPYPTVSRYYNTFTDPNLQTLIPGPCPDFDGDGLENDGIARVLAITEGVDAQGNPVKVWDVCNVVFSGPIARFEVAADRDTLYPGESANISIVIHDANGNPIVPGSQIRAEAAAGKLSWTELTTDDPGRTHYSLKLTNNLDPNDPNARPTATPVTITVQSPNGNDQKSTETIQLLVNRP